MEKMKRLYEKYKVNFDEQFKKDLLEVMINTYGEDCRKKFEEKINNIQVYTKFTVKKLKEYVEQHRGEEDFSLEEEVIAEYEKEEMKIKEECNKEILRRQYKLMDKVKKRLSPAEAYKLDTELQELVSSGRIPIEFSRVDLKMATLFEELGDFSVLEKIIDEHQLEDSSKTPNREEFVNDYFRDVIEINKDFDRKINKRYSAYSIIEEECEDYNVDIDLLGEFGIYGGAVTTFANRKNINDTQEAIFIEPFRSKQKTLATLAHEALHSVEKEIIIDEKNQTIDTRTGFDGKIKGANTKLLSECMHVIILDDKIYPRLRDLGYEIEDSNDYYIKSLETNKDFLKNFETAILTARHGNIDILLDVVGKQNFIEYAELQNKYYVPNSNQEAQALLKKMKEYSRENLGERIGKLTLNEQKDIPGKKNVTKEINDLMKYITKDERTEVNE